MYLLFSFCGAAFSHSDHSWATDRHNYSIQSLAYQSVRSRHIVLSLAAAVAFAAAALSFMARHPFSQNLSTFIVEWWPPMHTTPFHCLALQCIWRSIREINCCAWFGGKCGALGIDEAHLQFGHGGIYSCKEWLGILYRFSNHLKQTTTLCKRALELIYLCKFRTAPASRKLRLSDISFPCQVVVVDGWEKYRL